MGQITSGIGLATGINITDTVNKLISLQAIPRDRLVASQKSYRSQQGEITSLTALTLGVQLAIKALKTPSLYSSQTVASDNDKLVTAVASGGAAAGDYSFTPIRTASTNQLQSNGLAAADQPLGAGTFSFGFGGYVNQAVNLSELNGGSGVARGQIRITDRSGAAAVVDLRYSQSIDDVLNAINRADGIQVQASTDGGRLVLTDLSGGAGNLKVQEVNGGATAHDLGLSGVNVAASTVTGRDLQQLSSKLALSQLNAGNGVDIRPGLNDLHVTLQDGTSLDIGFRGLTPGAPQEKTLGDLLHTINQAAPAKLSAAISADGKQIVLSDHSTSSGGTFQVTSAAGGKLAEDLGLTGAAVGGVITGDNLLGGLKSTNLRVLNGGQGLGQLGQLQITNRGGASASVNLAGAVTLDDVIDRINAAGIGVTASYNQARNGLAITDTTGATASNLIIASGDGTNTADKLKLAVNAGQDSFNGGALHKQVVSANTLLSAYNQGQGVRQGSFLITDSTGNSGAINLAVLKPSTIGDVVSEINQLHLHVSARINDAGDGIALVDTGGGAGTLAVADVGGGGAAADLHLAAAGVATTVGGQPSQVINGSTTFQVTLNNTDTLTDLVSKINALNAGVTAGVFNDGSGGQPYHLSLISGKSGGAGALLVDGGGVGLGFQTITEGRDALLQFGVGNGAGVGQLISSASNTFKSVAPGLDVTIAGAATSPVNLHVANSAASLSSAVKSVVDLYNKLVDKLTPLTSYDTTTNIPGDLFGTSIDFRLNSDISRALNDQVFGVGSVHSLANLGVTFDQSGHLQFDSSVLAAKYSASPSDVKNFFTTATTGFVAKADAVLESLDGAKNSLLINAAATAQSQIDSAQTRIDSLNAQLDSNRTLLTNQYNQLEITITKIKANLTSIGTLQYIGYGSATYANAGTSSR